MRLRLFLDRWRQGRFVEYGQRERSGAHYHPRFGTEFGIDVLLTCQGAPSLMRWRGMPLMKNVFDFAIYPALIAELRPRTMFEVGSGSGASAAWFADNLTLSASKAASIQSIWSRPPTRTSAGHFLSGRLLRSGALVRSRGAALRAASLARRRGRASQCRSGAGAVSPIPAVGRLSGGRGQRCEAGCAAKLRRRAIPATIWSIRALPTISAATQPARPIRSSSARRCEANSAATNRPRPSAIRYPAERRQEVDQADLRQPAR